MEPYETECLYDHNNIIQAFCRDVTHHKLAHACLLTGPKSIGKATTAFFIAKYLCDKEAKLTFTNNKCVLKGSDISRSISTGYYPDLLYIYPEDDKDIAVEAIRPVGEFLYHASRQSSCKIVIIDEADRLNVHASNALLKLLEEPPLHRYFFLITHKPSHLLATIKSRCHTIRFIANNQKKQSDIDNDNPALIYSNGQIGLSKRVIGDAILPIYEKWLSLFHSDKLPNFQEVQSWVEEQKDSLYGYDWMCFSAQRLCSLLLDPTQKKIPAEQVFFVKLANKIPIYAIAFIHDFILNALTKLHKAHLDKVTGHYFIIQKIMITIQTQHWESLSEGL
jgi:hypothetical protein